MMYLRMLPVALVMTGLLLGWAGRLDAWALAYASFVWLSMGTVNTVLLRLQPELLAERMRPPSDRDRKSRIASIPALALHYAVAGLDARWGWGALPLGVRIGGFVLLAVAFALVGWTLVSNPYASSAVRIQSERGHQVISSGPYGFVRHPMYLGVLFFALGSPLALGSLWAVLPLAPLLGLFVHRTLVEDAMLRTELPGYADYAARVRFRVLPLVF